MKPPKAMVRKAAAKRMKAQGGPSEEQQAPAPKRRVTRASLPTDRHESPPAQEVDLTADTPPEEARVEGVGAEELLTLEPAGAEPPTSCGPPPTGGDRSLGEGPSGTSPQPVQSSAGSPPRTEPEPPRNAEGSGAGPTPSTVEGRRAEYLMSHVIQPDIQERLRTMGVNKFFRGIFAALVEVTNSVALAREAIGEGEAVARQVQQDAEDAEARAEAAEKALESVRAEYVTKIKETEDRLEAKAGSLQAALSQLAEAESAIEARNLHINDLNSAIQEAEDRARRAEEEKAAAVSRVTEVEAAAEARVAAAVEEFKASDHFTRELTEANADFYVQGFDDARKKIARVLNLPHAMDIVPDEESDGSSGDETAAGA